MLNNSSLKTTMWRREPAICAGSNTHDLMPYLFPSARQALTAILKAFNLGRVSRVAVPEFSGACLLNAVSSLAMPIPMREVISYNIPVDAVILYELWGWQYPFASYQEFCSTFPMTPLIVDKVDNPDFHPETSSKLCHDGRPYGEVWSLFKVLGLSGGGFAKLNGSLLHSETNPLHQSLWTDLIHLQGHSLLMEDLIKTKIHHVPDSVNHFVRTNDILGSYQLERERRRKNIAVFIKQEQTKDWEPWMFDSISAGAAPGLIPLYRNAPKSKLMHIQKLLNHQYQIESSIYNFNFSGSILAPVYETCLCIPVHGLVDAEHLAYGIYKI